MTGIAGCTGAVMHCRVCANTPSVGVGAQRLLLEPADLLAVPPHSLQLRWLALHWHSPLVHPGHHCRGLFCGSLAVLHIDSAQELYGLFCICPPFILSQPKNGDRWRGGGFPWGCCKGAWLANAVSWQLSCVCRRCCLAV